MNNFKIVEVCPISLHGFKIPVGAMYGKDKKGMWICLDYRKRNKTCIAHAHYAKVRNAAGVFVSKKITPAKYAYSLRLYRLDFDGVPDRYYVKHSRYGNDVRWHSVVEHSATTNKILELVRRYPEKCVIKAPKKVSNSAAKQISRPINRRVVREYTPYARPY